ncbi:MAG: hypothetical protein N2450_06130 [bacterium]|nr:hypothetical protein [bacterium]
MPHYLAYFSKNEEIEPVYQLFEKISNHLNSIQVIESGKVHRTKRSVVFIPTINQKQVQFVQFPDGWIAIAGIAYNTVGREAKIDFSQLYQVLSSGSKQPFYDLEGCYSISFWNDTKGIGYLSSDVAIQRNSYYYPTPNGIFVGTLALALAKHLGLKLNAWGAAHLLMRGTILAPHTMFEGLFRLDMGTLLEFSKNTFQILTYWEPYQTHTDQYKNKDEVATDTQALILDIFNRLALLDPRMIADLTGGYDSRLVASTLHFLGLPFEVTVNGMDEDPDVKVSMEVSKIMNWKLRFNRQTEGYPTEVTPQLTKQLIYYTNGDIKFNAILRQMSSRLKNSKDFAFHLGGGGLDNIRDFSFGQEYWRIHQVALASVKKQLEYRFYQDVSVQKSNFNVNWMDGYNCYLEDRIYNLYTAKPNLKVGQQLDAAFNWRNVASFSSLFISSNAHTMPAISPLRGRRFFDFSFQIPLKYRIGHDLLCRVQYRMCPRAAMIKTIYGGYAAPLSFKTFPMAINKRLKDAKHFIRKVYRVKLKLYSGITPSKHFDTFTPCLTTEFTEMMRPSEMLTRNLYKPEFIKEVLEQDLALWKRKAELILRMATIELICREIEDKPDNHFWNPVVHYQPQTDYDRKS